MMSKRVPVPHALRPAVTARRARRRARYAPAVGALACCLLLGPVVARAQSMDPKVEERVKRATVMVFTAYSKNTEGDSPLGSGSGFFVNRTGLCISNDHVTDPGHGKSSREKTELWQRYNRLTWRVIVNSGTDEEKEYKAKVLYSNDQADMAVMQVYDDDGSLLDTPYYLDFFPTEQLTVKTKLWDLGFPGGDKLSSSKDKHPTVKVTWGSVIDIPRIPSGRVKWIETNLLVNQGNSGGPVVDINGRLVGIATLASGGDEGRSAFAILIPADLTRQMIRYAFEEKTIPGGADIYPFLDLLYDESGIYSLPTIERSRSHTCVTLEGGSVFCGDVAGDKVAWPTPLGNIEIPADITAYLITQDDQGTVLLDGGDRFRIRRDGTFPFAPSGADAMDIDLADIRAIAFKRPTTPPAVPRGEVFVIGGDQWNLSIADPNGKVRFRAGGIEVETPITQVAAVSENDSYDKVLTLTNGSHMTGSFLDHEITGTLAWSGTPVSFSLQNVIRAVMHTTNYAERMRARELPLADALNTTDSRLVEVAKALDAHDLPAAEAGVEQLLEKDTLRDLSEAKEDEVRRFEGELLLRKGKFEQAYEVFRRLRSSDVDDVRWHAGARIAMLDRFPQGKFDGKLISDPQVFEAAARQLVRERTVEAARALEEIERVAGTAPPPPRREYSDAVKRAEETEKSLLIVNRLSGGSMEELLVRLWRNWANLHSNEIFRLQFERNQLENDDGRGRNDRRSSVQERQIERRLTRFENNIQKAQEAYQRLQAKLRDAGFIIDDSDREVTDAS